MAGGITNLVNAFMGGDKYEMEAFNRQMNQMTAAGTREAALAQKLAEAEIIRDKLSARKNTRGAWGDRDPLELELLLGNEDGDLTGGMSDTIKNRAFQEAFEMAKQIKTQNPDDPYGTLNAFTSAGTGTQMTPSNVAVAGQAQAKIAEAEAAARLRDAQATEASAGAAHKTAQAADVNRQTELRSSVPASNFTLTRDQSSLLNGWGIQDADGETQEVNMLPAFYAFMTSNEGRALAEAEGPQGAFTYFVSELVQGRIPGPVGAQAPGQPPGETKSRRRLLYNTDTGEFTEVGAPAGHTGVMP